MFASVRIGEENDIVNGIAIPASEAPVPLPATTLERPSAGIRFERAVDPETVRRMIEVLERAPMILVPTGERVHVALGSTGIRKGMCGLAVLIQKVLTKDPFSGHMFVFRGKRATYIKIPHWDGNGLCLFSKRLERGRFAWPTTTESGGTIVLTPAQLSMLIEGIVWRAPERTWRPALAG